VFIELITIPALEQIQETGDHPQWFPQFMRDDRSKLL
jgi:hypothetical protein